MTYTVTLIPGDGIGPEVMREAIKILRAKLYENERERVRSERAAARKGQVGSGDRSERIRTYNYPQNRVTDHRINLTLYKLEAITAGNMDELIQAMKDFDKKQRLESSDGTPDDKK